MFFIFIIIPRIVRTCQSSPPLFRKSKKQFVFFNSCGRDYSFTQQKRLRRLRVFFVLRWFLHVSYAQLRRTLKKDQEYFKEHTFLFLKFSTPKTNCVKPKLCKNQRTTFKALREKIMKRIWEIFDE